ncbi:MAG TPA: hypothetical protein P5121_32965 [Caldilineaceae bacterium]|nr:hypothetical protein [Caldilineaceae bacterium]MCB0183494.1 hypothetical protein [Caldilineaceae bacterium]HRW09976.1 hypothetical protein [Caldilineaceae bacterium]
MITTIVVSFFGASCLASVVVFAACAASARADEVQRQAFSHFYEENEQYTVEKHQKVAASRQLALNP